ncbi:sensor domain-containing protein [Rhizobium sp. LjRoot30]|uniref:sensor domain-containing protein n=1 Tax=Rhizobium sp. LjRoot30 TaxID=3342320 RepID=UPI003F505E0C
MSTGLAFLDADGFVLFHNPAFSKLHPAERSVSGLALADLVHPEDRDNLINLIVATRRGDIENARVELRCGTAENGYHWYRIALNASTASPPAAILVTTFDIHARKTQVDELILRENRWRDALVNSGTGVWDQNYATGVMYYSDTWKAIRGLAPDEQLAEGFENWLQLLHPDDRDYVVEAIERQNSGDPDYAMFQYRERHKDGHWVWVECRGAAVEWDKDGKPTRVIGTDTDITQRKAAEEMLAQLSRRLELALSISDIGVFEADLETSTVKWDDRLLEMFGMEGTPNLKPGDLWESMLHPEDAATALACVETHLDGENEFRNDYRVVLANGKVRHIESRNKAFTDSNGKRKLVGANWDVTGDIILRRELERAKTLAEARNRELEMAKARIEHNALHDYLTGLPNRRYLDEVLDARAEECRRSGATMVIFHIDLDRFKQINDTLGHRAGDTMLQHAANVLKANLRSQDFVARIGGDEFVLLTDMDGTQRKLASLADRIIKELCKPVLYDGHTIRFGASIGIASDDGAELNAKQLLLNADIALYRAKNRGRNRHEFFSRDVQDQIIHNKRLADDILYALEQDQFVPFYQPQFCARTLDVTGVETLVRWVHPEKGILTPDKFLPVAEDLDVVSMIDALVLEKALAHHRLWMAKKLPVPKISVNVSARRLNDPALTKKLRGMKIKPGTVSFELLESIFLDTCDTGVVQNLARLRKLGIDIEIDDFGTGHASIVSLLRISPTTLKIDRELVKLIPSSAEQRKMVGSIIEIGRSLNINVVAEGVETRDHVRILSELGCDILQGWALARAMPFEAIEPFLIAEEWRASEHPVHEMHGKIRRAGKG